MKKAFSFFLVVMTGVVMLGFAGCEEEKKEDLTDWAIPNFEKEPAKSEEEAVEEPVPRIYVVKKGDHISAIAAQHGISPRRLAEANGLGLKGPESIIHPGQELIIPRE